MRIRDLAKNTILTEEKILKNVGENKTAKDNLKNILSKNILSKTIGNFMNWNPFSKLKFFLNLFPPSP